MTSFDISCFFGNYNKKGIIIRNDQSIVSFRIVHSIVNIYWYKIYKRIGPIIVNIQYYHMIDVHREYEAQLSDRYEYYLLFHDESLPCHKSDFESIWQSNVIIWILFTIISVVKCDHWMNTINTGFPTVFHLWTQEYQLWTWKYYIVKLTFYVHRFSCHDLDCSE